MRTKLRSVNHLAVINSLSNNATSCVLISRLVTKGALKAFLN